MKKIIIAIYGRQNEGKTSTIINVFNKLISDYVNSTVFPSIPTSGTGDIYVLVTINGVRIGFESAGDPNSRMVTAHTVEKLAANKTSALYDLNYSDCDIIICASRTSGGTVTEIDRVANLYNYHTIWKSSYYAPNLNHQVVNRIAAEEIVNLIKSIITTEI